jgi:hypothetical protein
LNRRTNRKLIYPRDLHKEKYHRGCATDDADLNSGPFGRKIFLQMVQELQIFVAGIFCKNLRDLREHIIPGDRRG